jgi:hypothetical protein
MAKFEYPFQNLSLTNMKGERWKDIPNLEGYFMVSNLGRVKRLPRKFMRTNGKIQTLSEMIITPVIGRSNNKFKGDSLKSLEVNVMINAVNHHFMISRLLYNCFIETFDLNDRGILILNKDCDGLNVNLKNLIKTDCSNRGKRVAELKRADYYVTHLNKEEISKATKKAIAITSKQISQYALNGKKIKTFPSCSAAERAFGLKSGMVGSVADGNRITSAGYIWRWGKEKKVEDIESIKLKRKAASRLKYGQKVTQYDFEGNKIAEYNSYIDAATACSTSVKSTAAYIRLVTIGKAKSAAGYYWQNGIGKDKINLRDHLWGAKSSGSYFAKKVKQYTLEGKLVKTHKSIRDASKAIGVTPHAIRQACKSEKHISKGFIWKYA